VRGFDLVARYGGEEFVAVMPDTDLTLARAVAERLREMIEALPVKASEKTGDIDVTISIGVAMLESGDDSSALLKRADEALYRAKAAGRNRVDSLEA
ncbi:MAG: diguanylate cyclase, partial [Rhodospirillales bacterium]|nr:diguanylate cyclase [Rhodospirillales bacterium]